MKEIKDATITVKQLQHKLKPKLDKQHFENTCCMLKLINLDINDEKERLSPQSPVVSLLRRTVAAWLQCEDKM